MANVNLALLSKEAWGSIINGVLTFSRRKTGNICRHQKKQKDKMTIARQDQRMRFSKSNNWWLQLTQDERDLFLGYTFEEA